MSELPTLTDLLRADAAFALLDDATAAAGHEHSRLYHGLAGQLECSDPAALDGWQARIDQALADGMHVVLLGDYAFGLALQDLPADPPAQTPAAAPPALRAQLYHHCHRLDAAAVEHWLAAAAPAVADGCGLYGWTPMQDQAHFTDAVAQIQQAIGRGDTYQVNHTFALEGLAHGHPVALYRRLRQRQRAPYAALIRQPDRHWVLSLSPELFICCSDGIATAAPMKGTTAAGDDAHSAAQWLRNDAKNRAENVMIVDLLRNDLGRIAQPGSVQVPALFQVQHNGKVLGMTSQISAQLRQDVGLAELLRAVYPCGSITGAPKRSTMALIQQLETGGPQPHHRGLYTGAIGWLDGAAQGPAMQLCLSVPIRTLELRPHAEPGLHHARLPVGAGITIDSDAAAEWAECRLKAAFACQAMAGLELIETLRVDAAGQIALLPQHLARLRASAGALGIPAEHGHWPGQLQRYQQRHLPPGQAWRLRLALHPHGQLQISHQPLLPLPDTGPVRLLLADSPVSTPLSLLAHKTSLRADYDAAVAAATAAGAFDVLYFNAAGQLTEGARSNVFVQIDGAWWTPPVSAGLLPGVMRAQLLADPRWQARERNISGDELLRAQALMVCNALRGPLPAQLAGVNDVP